MGTERKCEVCGTEFLSKYSLMVGEICPNCGISGYHDDLLAKPRLTSDEIKALQDSGFLWRAT